MKNEHFQIPEEILQKIEYQFMHYGVKSLTMDDISRELGISKKTLYQYFPHKKGLVKEIMQYHLSHRESDIVKIRDEADDAIEEWYSIYENNCKFFRELNPYIIFDLKKYYPESWQLFEDHKEQNLYNLVLINIKRGIKEGLYRENLHPEIIARFYVSRMEDIVDRSVFPENQFSRDEVFEEYIQYHLRGIASDKGIEYLKNIKSSQK